MSFHFSSDQCSERELNRRKRGDSPPAAKCTTGRCVVLWGSGDLNQLFVQRGMSHFVLKRGRYWEEWDNVPGQRGKKRFVKYWGRRSPFETVVDDFEQQQERAYASAMRQANKIDAYQLATFGETGAERRERLDVASHVQTPATEAPAQSVEVADTPAPDVSPAPSEPESADVGSQGTDGSQGDGGESGGS